jgi:hypothetical protein
MACVDCKGCVVDQITPPEVNQLIEEMKERVEEYAWSCTYTHTRIVPTPTTTVLSSSKRVEQIVK